MNTTETVLLIVLTTLLSILLIVSIAVGVAVLKLVAHLRQVAEKAESVVTSVESAAEIFTDTQGKLALFKLVRNVIKMTQKGRK